MKYTGRMEIPFEMGDRVWLSPTHFRTIRPSKKLDYKRAGPYTVSKTNNRRASKSRLPKMMRNHKVFHVSLLDRYTPPTMGQLSSEPHLIIVDHLQESEVDQILDSK